MTIAGAIRISFGYMSTRADADAFLQFIATYFVTGSTDLSPSVNRSIPSSAAIANSPLVDASVNNLSSLARTDMAPTSAVAGTIVDNDTCTNADADADAAGNSHTKGGADTDADDAIRISALCVYPVKSCGAIRASEWPLGPRGFLFDREWTIVGARSERVAIQTDWLLHHHVFL